ncbi:MAG: RdgB/HAM1 family non-canonical purine NTP pyrophosphatase [Dehalococcoidia bacterium]
MHYPLGYEPERKPRQIVLATHNAGKIREFRELLGGRGFELLTPAEAGIVVPPIIETDRSYTENAVNKATAVARAAGLPALADDSGLEVDALGGAPGPLSARFGGLQCRTDEDRYRMLLRRLEGVPAQRRTARFRAVLALAIPGNHPVVREGVVEGRIALAARGSGGHGYDPVFELPDGRTAAELTPAEKNAVSHRARAFEALAATFDHLRMYESERWAPQRSA